MPQAVGARNHTQCDSLLIGKDCGAHTFPYMEIKNPSAKIEHEATTSKISANQLFYCRQRGISEEDAVNMIVNGFCKEVFKELPMEFAGWNLPSRRRRSSTSASKALSDSRAFQLEQESAICSK
jgi:Fe-S cluster assembly protein SufB